MWTRWGCFRLDAASYRDYLAGRLWISDAPVKVVEAARSAPREVTSETSARAQELRELAARRGVYAVLQEYFSGDEVEIPYRTRMKEFSIEEMALSVRASNGLMRAGAASFGKLWELMNRPNGLRAVRNLGSKSETEIQRAFLACCYSHLSPGEQALFWQRNIDRAGEDGG